MSRESPDSWKLHYFNRIKDLVDQHQPDMLYTDGGIPMEVYGLGTAANTYNVGPYSSQGHPEAVCFSKTTMDCTVGTCVLDRERGVLDDIASSPWQTDTSGSALCNLGAWAQGGAKGYVPASATSRSVPNLDERAIVTEAWVRATDTSAGLKSNIGLRRPSRTPAGISWVTVFKRKRWLFGGPHRIAEHLKGAFAEAIVAPS